MKIHPEAVFERIESQIREATTQLNHLSEFKFEFTIMQHTLQFNMINDKDIALIMEGLGTIVNNIKDQVNTTNKDLYEETIYFPFEKHTDKTRALMAISIKYNRSPDVTGDQISIVQGKPTWNSYYFAPVQSLAGF